MTARREDFVAWRESMNGRADRGVAIAVVAARALYGFIRRPDCDFPEFRVSVKRQEPIDVPTAKQFLEMRTAVALPVTDKRAVDQPTREAVFELLAGAGLRIEALLTLRGRNVFPHAARPYVMIEQGVVSCKGKTADSIPMSPYSAKVIGRYLAAKQIGPDALIFDISDFTVRKIMKSIAPGGLDITPHTMRHFYCSMNYFRNFDGGRTDPVWVRDAAGHSNISTTDTYLKLARRVVQTDAEWESWALGPAAEQKVEAA